MTLSQEQILTTWLYANTPSITVSGSNRGVSFSEISQPQAAGAPNTPQDSSASTAEELLAAVEKQTVLI